MRRRAKTALLVEFTGVSHLCQRIEEGFMKRMLVLTLWRHADPDGRGEVTEGLAP